MKARLLWMIKSEWQDLRTSCEDCLYEYNKQTWEAERAPFLCLHAFGPLAYLHLINLNKLSEATVSRSQRCLQVVTQI